MKFDFKSSWSNSHICIWRYLCEREGLIHYSGRAPLLRHNNKEYLSKPMLTLLVTSKYILIYVDRLVLRANYCQFTRDTCVSNSTLIHLLSPHISSCTNMLYVSGIYYYYYPQNNNNILWSYNYITEGT